MAAAPTLNELLAQATTARHKLLTGTLATKVEVAGGMVVEFTQTNREALESYIAELQAQIAGQKTIGALTVIF